MVTILMGSIIALKARSQEETTNTEDEPPSNYCFDKIFPEAITQLKIDYKKASREFFEIGPDHEVSEIYDLYEFLNVVKNLPQERWATPNAVWPMQSIKAAIKINGITECNIVYTQNKIYSQYKDQQGFIVQPISIFTFRRLNETLFSFSIV